MTRRIAPLANLPLFHRLAGRKAVVLGASAAAEWKAELLLASGADVVRLVRWTLEDLEGVTIAIADLQDREEAAAFASAARKAGALVNIIDQPDLSDVQFGSIVNRSPVIIGISTDGAAPMLGQSIRSRIESLLPSGISKWAEAARSWRGLLKARVGEFELRRAFWTRVVSAAWADPERTITGSEFEALLAAKSETGGQVILVGAGPGDPGLLTLKALRALQAATVILHDNLVGGEVLELARREARRIAVGKSGHAPSCKQSEISRLMIDLALSGETVVRLKGGDPLIFGRAAEEIDACKSAGVSVSVIPGISAAQGAGASLLLSLTERRHARRVQFVTGHGADGRLPSDIDWLSVADRKVTTIVYMPRATLDQFVRTALAKGLDPATPAIAIAWATLPGEERAAGTIAEIGALAKTLPAGAPVTIIIGWVGRHLVRSSPAVLPFHRAIAS